MPTISGTVYDDAGAPAAGRIVRAYRRDTGALLGSAVTSDGQAVPGDEHYNSVSLYLPCDGANGSVTVTDKSSLTKAVATIGSVTISTAQSKFGGASALFSGSTATLICASDPAFDLGTGDFTLEAWYFAISAPTGYLTVLEVQYPTDKHVTIRFGDAGFGNKLQVAVDSSSLATVWSCGLTTSSFVGAWSHIAFTRQSGVCRLFVNGQIQNLNNGVNPSTYPYASFTDNTSVAPNQSVKIGTGIAGYLDDIRITKGVARYTANFTPPTAPHYDRLPADATTVGSYGITTAYTGEVQRIVLDDDAGTLYNDLIDRVVLA